MILQNAEKETDGFGSIEAKRYAPASFICPTKRVTSAAAISSLHEAG
jgi:hypothetical protein